MHVKRTNLSRRPGFTLIELIAVILMLAVLSGIALPRYFDSANEARETVDEAAIAGIGMAIRLAYAQHRITNEPVTEWVTTVGNIADVMETGQLPEGITISGAKLADQRGNTYTLTAETESSAAFLTLDSGGGGGGGGGGGS